MFLLFFFSVLEFLFICRILVQFLSLRCAHVQPASPCKSLQVRTSCSCSCKSLQVFSFGKYPAPRPLSPPSTNRTNAQLSLSLLRLQPRLAAQKCNYIASKSFEQPSLCIPQVAAWQPLSQLLRGMSQQS